MPVSDADRRTITILDARGHVVASFRLSLPDAAVLGVFHLAVSADRTLVAAVEARASDGRYANLLVFSDLQGAIKRIVRTNPFGAVHPVFLPDGRLVCVGREIDEQLNEIGGYHVLRFYSPEGVLLGKAAPIGLLRPTRRDPEPIEWDVVAGDGRIGMLDRDNLRFVELDGRGRIVRPLAPLGFERPARAMGLALLSGGRVLIAVSHPDAARSKDRYQLYLLRPSGAAFERQAVTEITPPAGYEGFFVAGACHGELVLLTTPVGAMVFVPESNLPEAYA